MDPGMFPEDTPWVRTRRGSRKGKEVAEPEAPGWAKRLKAAIKKTFCLTNDVNKRQYQAYKREKLNRHSFNEYRRSQGEDIPYDSEMRISPEHKWLYKHRHYYEDDASSAHRQPTPDGEYAEE